MARITWIDCLICKYKVCGVPVFDCGVAELHRSLLWKPAGFVQTGKECCGLAFLSGVTIVYAGMQLALLSFR